MAATQYEHKISLKLVVDKEKNKVIFAETDSNLVDILLSFLTMPLGTIARLLDAQQKSHAIGSLTSLYRGMASLDNKYLCTKACKKMLLYPRNSAQFLCNKLQLNINDRVQTSYYKGCYHNHLSTFWNTYCNCGCRLAEEVTVKDCGMSKEVADKKGGVFLNANFLFIIMDDMQVFPASGNFALKRLNDTDGKNLDMKLLNIGLEEVLLILRMSLLTDSPLTNVFLSDQSLKLPKDTLISSLPLHQLGSEEMTKQSKNEGETSSICKEIITVNLVISKKYENKVLYAEAGEDFVDLLFSFLAYPLGTVEHLFDGHLKLTSIDNLYKSVKELDVYKLIGSDNLKAMLISPKIANKFRGKNKLLNIDEEDVTPYLHTSKNLRKGGVHEYYLTLTRHDQSDYRSQECTIVDPKSPEGSTLSQEGYVKGPATFMVSDDLKVTPFSSYEAISLLRGLNIGINDVEEQIIKVGKNEALSILNASLFSASALTLGLNSILNKPKAEERSLISEDFIFNIV